MDTVRLARDVGDVSGLFPAGITRLRDIPYVLLQAIKMALVYLSFEELPQEDQPPRSIWTNGELLREHMDEVRRKYKSRGDGGDGGREDIGQRNGAARMLITG